MRPNRQAGVKLTNITAAWAVDREFVYIVLWRPLGRLWSLWLALGCPWAPFGHPLGSLWLSWATFSLPLGVLGLPLAPFWPPLGRPWDPLGCLGAPVGSPGRPWGLWLALGTPTASRWLSSTAPAHKNKPPGICPPVPPVPPVPGVPAKRSTNYSSGIPFHTRRGSG